MAALINEGTQFLDVNGRPIVNGYVYIGEAGQDPKINKITIYSDRQLSTVIANPQRTDAYGRTVNKIWIEDRYSLKVEDANNVQKYQDLERGETPGTGLTVLTNVQGINAITAEASPAITAYVDKALYVLTVAAVNTAAVTLDAGGGAKSVTKNNGENIAAGDWPADTIQEVYYNEEQDRFEWANYNGISVASSIASLTSTVSANYERVNFSSVRQTVQTGPVDTDGFASYIVNNGGLSVITSGLDSDSLFISFGDGIDIKGEKNIVVELDENVTFTGLADNDVNYLYLEYDTGTETLTPGSTTLAPDYSLGKPSSPTTNQYWYPTDHRSRGEYWDGSAWQPVLRIFIGQATTSAGAVSSVTSYAFQGRYQEKLSTSITLNTAYTFNHNIGVENITDIRLYMNGFTTGGYSSSDRIEFFSTNSAYGAANNTRQLSSVVVSEKQLIIPIFNAGVSAVYALPSKTGGEGPSISLGDFSEISCRRAF